MLALQILVDGFAISALYALGASGFTLIFGVSGVLSLSHGGLMVLGAVAAWAATNELHVGAYIAIWAVYGVLAGIAGVLLGMFLGVSSYSAGPLTGSAFSIVVLGGLGSVSGSLVAAYVVGYLETVTAYMINPAYRFIPALLLLVLVMYIRPQGLFGRRCVMRAFFKSRLFWIAFIGSIVGLLL